MNIGDYIKQNKAFLGFGLLAIILLVALSFYIKKPKPQSVFVKTTPTITASPSATLTPTATPSAMISHAGCQVTLASKADMFSVLPDPDCTPGATNSAVTQVNIQTTICKAGYEESVRPSVSYTNKLKYQQMVEYGYATSSASAKLVAVNYEEDHFIPLELGGNPTAPTNLWPELDNGTPNEKDKVENYLHRQVCNGVITLAQAQKEITTNWYNVFVTLK